MTSSTNFVEARTATARAALDLFGDGYQKYSVHAAWDAVGVPRTYFNRLILNTPTALGLVDSTVSFALTDWDRDGVPDLAGIFKRNTGSGTTEVHILSGASGLRQFILQTGTAFDQTDDNSDFGMADWDHDGLPDLVGIRKNLTGTQRTEVRILSMW